MMNKGISPLIATVIIISIVIAMSAMFSTFLTGTIKEQQAQAGKGSERAVQCPSLMGNLEIDENEVIVASNNKSLSMLVSNNAGEKLEKLKIRVYNTNERNIFLAEKSNMSTTTLEGGKSEYINASSINVGNCINKIDLISGDCPGYKSAIKRSTCTGSWEITA